MVAAVQLQEAQLSRQQVINDPPRLNTTATDRTMLNAICIKLGRIITI